MTHLSRLGDAHIHLQGWGSRAEAFLHLAEAQGIQQFICNGSGEADWPQVAALAQQFPSVIPAFGLHPWDAAEASPDWLDSLQQQLLARPSAVGEIGLDRGCAEVPFETQERVFLAQLRIAKRLQRPVMIHCVRAWDWLQRLFKSEPPEPQSLLFHSFAGSTIQVRELSRKFDAYFSIGQSILNRPSPKFLASIRGIPQNRLLIETDLAGPPAAGPIHADQETGSATADFPEVATLRRVAATLADALGIPQSELAALTWENGQKFLRQWGLH